MGVKNTLLAIPALSIDAATFAGAFLELSAVTGLPQACSILKIINNSTVGVVVSYDAITNHDFVPAGQQLLINAQSNSQPNNNVALFAKGTRVYILGAPAGTGLIYLAAYFQPQGV